MGDDAQQVYRQIVQQAVPLVTGTSDRGLICVFDGFFLYETAGGFCSGVVAPKVACEHPSEFWIALLTGHDPDYLIKEEPTVSIPLTIETDVTGAAGADAVLDPPRGSFHWLPPWTKYMQADPLPVRWREMSETPLLLLDAHLRGGNVFALPDSTVGEQRWLVNGRPFNQRLSSVGVWGCEGKGTLRLSDRAIPFGSDVAPWTVVILSYRQVPKPEEPEDASRRRIARAHHHVIAGLHQFDMSKVTVSALQSENDTTQSPAPPIDQLIDKIRVPGRGRPMTPGEVGCNAARVALNVDIPIELPRKPIGADDYGAIVAHVSEIVGSTSRGGGCIVLLDGFFLYERSPSGLSAVCSPMVHEKSAYVCKTLQRHSGWEPIDWTPPALLTVKYSLAQNVAERLTCQEPPVDSEWLPNWTDYTQAARLSEDWRDHLKGGLIFDMRLCGGLLTALPDANTFTKTSAWLLDGRLRQQATSSLGLYCVVTEGQVTIGGKPFAFGGADGWLVVLISHTHDLDAESASRLHHNAIVNLYSDEVFPRLPSFAVHGRPPVPAKSDVLAIHAIVQRECPRAAPFAGEIGCSAQVIESAPMAATPRRAASE